MAAKRTSKTRTVNKTAFVRSLPSTLSAANVVAKGKAEGITLSIGYVYGIRSKSKADPAKRGPDRPKKTANGGIVDHGLVVEIERMVERIVEAKVGEFLRSKLAALR